MQLLEASSEIAEGNLSRRVEVAARDERGELARAFNTMTEKLAKKPSRK